MHEKTFCNIPSCEKGCFGFCKRVVWAFFCPYSSLMYKCNSCCIQKPIKFFCNRCKCIPNKKQKYFLSLPLEYQFCHHYCHHRLPENIVSIPPTYCQIPPVIVPKIVRCTTDLDLIYYLRSTFRSVNWGHKFSKETIELGTLNETIACNNEIFGWYPRDNSLQKVEEAWAFCSYCIRQDLLSLENRKKWKEAFLF